LLKRVKIKFKKTKSKNKKVSKQQNIKFKQALRISNETKRNKEEPMKQI